jgi:hypothetical protein
MLPPFVHILGLFIFSSHDGILTEIKSKIKNTKRLQREKISLLNFAIKSQIVPNNHS